MKAILIRKMQGEGCDYTIGCGTAIKWFEANTQAELYDKAEAYMRDYGEGAIDGEFALESCKLIYIEREFDFMPILKKWVKDNEEKEMEEVRLQKEAEERVEYERLQAKFGKK